MPHPRPSVRQISQPNLTAPSIYHSHLTPKKISKSADDFLNLGSVTHMFDTRARPPFGKSINSFMGSCLTHVNDTSITIEKRE